eukprot:m.18237 g.18237  ORF g.18237 m.18237 type:complete len:309 (-) comp5286_c0_seq1:150-1076(-)
MMPLVHPAIHDCHLQSSAMETDQTLDRKAALTLDIIDQALWSFADLPHIPQCHSHERAWADVDVVQSPLSDEDGYESGTSDDGDHFCGATPTTEKSFMFSKASCGFSAIRGVSSIDEDDEMQSDGSVSDCSMAESTVEVGGAGYMTPTQHPRGTRPGAPLTPTRTTYIRLEGASHLSRTQAATRKLFKSGEHTPPPSPEVTIQTKKLRKAKAPASKRKSGKSTARKNSAEMPVESTGPRRIFCEEDVARLVPMEVLALDRKNFNEWDNENGFRAGLCPEEREILSLWRRKILARGYAKDRRQRNKGRR